MNVGVTFFSIVTAVASGLVAVAIRHDRRLR